MDPKVDYRVPEIHNSHVDSLQMLIQLPHLSATSVHMVNMVAAQLTLRLLMSYIYGAPNKARNANVVYTRSV